jgi:uncharacterized protein
MDDTVVGRQNEIARLRSLLARGKPQLVLMYGRRRVGKTHLLSSTWHAEKSFYFTASETTPGQNRASLLATFADWSGEPVDAADYPTWRSVFRLLLDHDSPSPLVITIDEFQYLGEDAKDLKGVASELNAAWERKRPSRALVFVIAGSSVRTLESLNDGGSPLHGRFAWQCRLRPFDYWHAGELSGLADLGDRARAYGVFGGTPRYLAAIDPEQTLAANIVSLMLDPSGEVRELVRTALFQEQGLRDIPKYNAILRAIGRGRTELNRIAMDTGLDNNPSLREKVERLISLDYVHAARNLGAGPKEPYRYRIADPAVRFFYDVVAPLESALATQRPRLVWERHIMPGMDSYMGFVFESMVEEAWYRLQEKLALPVVREWGRWESVDRNRNPVEIDVASTLVDRRVLTGAIKWNRKRVDVAVHFEHQRMLDRLADAGVAWANVARDPQSPLLYAAAGGFTKRFQSVARASRDEVYLWDLADLYG